MSNGKNVLRLAGLVGAALLGLLFFFTLMGVFGLRFAIAGLLVFVVGSVAIYRVFPTEGAEP